MQLLVLSLRAMSLYVCLLYSYVDKPKFKWKSVELGDQLDACVYYLSHSNLQVRQKQCTIQSLSLVQVCTIHIRRYHKSRLYYPRPLIPGGNSKPNARSPHGGRTPVYLWLIEILLKMMMISIHPQAFKSTQISDTKLCKIFQLLRRGKSEGFELWLTLHQVSEEWKSCEVCGRKLAERAKVVFNWKSIT